MAEKKKPSKAATRLSDQDKRILQSGKKISDRDMKVLQSGKKISDQDKKLILNNLKSLQSGNKTMKDIMTGVTGAGFVGGAAKIISKISKENKRKSDKNKMYGGKMKKNYAYGGGVRPTSY